jgi:hypothetical protein
VLLLVTTIASIYLLLVRSRKLACVDVASRSCGDVNACIKGLVGVSKMITDSGLLYEINDAIAVLLLVYSLASKMYLVSKCGEPWRRCCEAETM